MTLMKMILGLLAVGLLWQRSGSTSTDEHSNINQIQYFFNRDLTSIPRDLHPHTKFLILNQNSIKEITNLENYPELLYLTLSKNLLTTNDDIRRILVAKKLHLLDLSNNHLLTLNLDTFKWNSKLTELILDDNRGVMVDGTIPNLPHLQKLSMKNCNLTSLPWMDYRGVRLLKIFDLSGNPIREIPEEAIRSFPESLELVVDGDLYQQLINRSDVRDKKIKVVCGSPHSVNIPEALMQNNDLMTDSNPEAVNYVICAFIALLLLVLCLIEIFACLKKSRQELKTYNENNSRPQEHMTRRNLNNIEARPLYSNQFEV